MATEITQERAAFEAAYAAAYPMAAARPGKFDREDWGDYLDASVGIGWRMWQAGRWQAVRAAVEANRRERMSDNAACASKLSESDKQDQSGGVTARIMRMAVEYADACITRTVAGCTGRSQSEQQIAAMAAEKAYADLHDLLSGQLAASIDIADVRQYLDQWGCLAHPGVRALLARYGNPHVGKPAASAEADDPTLAHERALTELIDRIVPGLDTGDILADAKQASAALGLGVPVAQEPRSASDIACAWTVWWSHNKSKFTTPRQAALAAYQAASTTTAAAQDREDAQ